MVDDTQYFSIKKTNSWLWNTKLTRQEVLERINLEGFPRDWLVCPHGEADKAVDGERFSSDPNLFGARGNEVDEGEDSDQSGESRLCLDCGAPLREIRLIDKGDGRAHYPVEYAAMQSPRKIFTGRYEASGEIQAYLCGSCGAVRLYAKPHG